MITQHNKKRMLSAVVAAVAMMGITSCSSNKPLYTWHKYEDAAYQHYKKQTEKSEANFVKEIDKVINKQTGSRQTVPPGIFAEYGFYMVKVGKTTDGLNLLKMERELYPESEAYISRIINQVEKNNNETD